MTTHSPLYLLAALGVLSTSIPALAAVDTTQWKCESCPYPKGAAGSVEAGVGVVSKDSAKFGDYTGLQDKGGHAVLGGTLRYRGETGYYADLSATDLGLSSRSLAAQSGHEGQYSLRIAYDAVPRFFGDGAMTPFIGSGGSVLTLPAGFPADFTSGMPLASTLQPVEIGFDKKRLDLSGTLVRFQNWTYRASYTRDVRDGTRPLTGSFFSNAAQFAAPVDQVTDQLEVSASYATRRLQASLAYQISRFQNGPESLTWDNPFSPVGPGATRGQLALAPDNQMHQITGSAGYEITPTIRASADFAYGRLTQNEPYLASTLNSALAPSVPQLPAASLDGRVDTFNGNVKVTATPMADLRLSASYARNVRDNKTARSSYPQVATDMFYNGQTRENTPFDLTQDRFKLDADYRGIEQVKLSAGAAQDYRSRPFHEVVKTRETTLWGRVGVQASDDVSLSLKVAFADRNNSTYGVATWFGAPENPLLRKYQLAERKRSSAGVRADVALADGMSLGVDADISVDDYTDSAVGLTYGRNSGVGADLSAALSETLQLQVFARTDWMHSRQAGSEQGGLPDWWARNKDNTDVLGVGLRHAAIADKLDLGADLAFTRSRSDMTLEPVAGNALFPSATTSMNSLKVFATYRLRESLSVTASFWHERYRAQDWRLDGVAPATVPSLLSLGIQPPQYSVNVVRVAMRYGF